MMKGSGRNTGMGRAPVQVRAATLTSFLLLGSCSEFGISDTDEIVTDPIILEDVFVQAPLPRLDVLWVIDDTPSMADEQAALAAAISPFTDGLQDAGLSWQIGVVRTDISGEDAGVLQGLPWVINSSTDDPASALAAAASVGLNGQPPEAGLGAAWLALTDPLRGGLNRGLRRSDAALHIVVVSDGDDMSGSVLGGSPADAFELFLEEEAARTGQPAVLSAVVGDVPDGCAGFGGSALPGTRYAQVATATGGIIQSICEPDFSPLTAALAEGTVPWPMRFDLSQEPVSGTVRVEVDGSRLDTGWVLVADPPAILFDEPPTPGVEILIRYEVET
jgi:hypothetical protein